MNFIHIVCTADYSAKENEYMQLFFWFQAKSWVTLFLSLGGVLQGYGKANITPYIHAMVYHVPHLMRTHQGIRNFSGQGGYLKINTSTCNITMNL